MWGAPAWRERARRRHGAACGRAGGRFSSLPAATVTSTAWAEVKAMEKIYFSSSHRSSTFCPRSAEGASKEVGGKEKLTEWVINVPQIQQTFVSKRPFSLAHNRKWRRRRREYDHIDVLPDQLCTLIFKPFDFGQMDGHNAARLFCSIYPLHWSGWSQQKDNANYSIKVTYWHNEKYTCQWFILFSS